MAYDGTTALRVAAFKIWARGDDHSAELISQILGCSPATADRTLKEIDQENTARLFNKCRVIIRDNAA